MRRLSLQAVFGWILKFLGGGWKPKAKKSIFIAPGGVFGRRILKFWGGGWKPKAKKSVSIAPGGVFGRPILKFWGGGWKPKAKKSVFIAPGGVFGRRMEAKGEKTQLGGMGRRRGVRLC